MTRAVRGRAGVGWPAFRVRNAAAASAALAGARPEVEGEDRIVERATAEPGVDLPDRAGVDAAGVGAERGVDEASRGRRGALELSALELRLIR